MRSLLVALAVLATLVAGCELIAGLQDRSLVDASADSPTTPDGGSCSKGCLPVVEFCDAGACQSACGAKSVCVPDAGDAGPHCADYLTSPNDCGSCGHSCGPGFCDAGTCVCPPGMQTFDYTGATQMLTVPPCVSVVTITAYGAQGENAPDQSPMLHSAGLGGLATGTLAVVPGSTLYVNVGGQSTAGKGGWNGGGPAGTSSAGGTPCTGGPGGGGGGMSDVRVGGTGWSNIVIAAAGGGGSGRSYCNGGVCCGHGGNGGSGGGTTGGDGTASTSGSGVNEGHGGTQMSGGAGGSGDGTGMPGTIGGQSDGGIGANGFYDVAGGGGGGGYFGGGGGGGASSGSGVAGGGGAGGSSYIGGVKGGSTMAGVHTGNGQVVISW